MFFDSTTLLVARPVSKRLLVWNLDDDRLRAETVTPPAATHATEWAELGPADVPYRRTCPQFAEPPEAPTLSVE